MSFDANTSSFATTYKFSLHVKSLAEVGREPLIWIIFFGRLCQHKRYIMNVAQTVILSGILHNYILITLCCSPPYGWLPLSPVARARKADIVLYGTVRASPRQGPKKDHEGLYRALFEVHCSLKGGIVPRFINVSGFGFAGGLCTHSTAYLNNTYIAFIRRDTSTRRNRSHFYVDEINVESATILIKHKIGRSRAVLNDIVKMVGKNATLPLGATKDIFPGCPKLPQQPYFYPTANASGTRKILCHPRSHKHKKRRHKKCQAVTTPSTQMELTTTKLSSRMSVKRTKSILFSTTVKRHGDVEFQLHNHSTRSAGYRTRNICWCFVLIFHGLVLVVVKWHQT